jgi:hypothetical protein
MADKHLQFLDIPRKDPDKLPVELRTRQFREIYSQNRRLSRPGAAFPAAIPFANGNARSITTFRTGWR